MPTEQRLASSDSPGSPDPTRSGEDRAVRPTGWAALRPLVLRLHFYAGVLIAPFLLVAAVTGLLYACSFQAEKVAYAHELTAPVGTEKLPLSRQVADARKAHPEGKIAAVRPAPQPGDTTRVLLSDVPGVSDDHQLAVFVDPYTGNVRGLWRPTVPRVHCPCAPGSMRSIAICTWARAAYFYSELAASWLWVVAGGGLALWIGRKRKNRTLRALALPDRTATGRRRTLSWHGAVGLWAAVGLIFLSATGLTWSAYAGANIGDLREALGQATPTVSTAATKSDAGHDGHGGSSGMTGMPDIPGMGGTKENPSSGSAPSDVGIDKVLRAARAQGLSDPVEVGLPTDQGTTYVVKQVQRSWPEKQDAIAVDPATGKVTDVSRFTDYPVLAKLTRYGIDLHTGTLFGIANQIALAALALALIFLILWGYRMWWQRRPTRDRTLSFGRPMPRGAWLQVPLPVLIPLVLAAGAVGWLVPLLGISLVAFLAVDIALGALARRRRVSSAAGD